MRFWLSLTVLGFVAGHLLSVAYVSGVAYSSLGPFRLGALADMLPVGAAFVAPALIVLFAFIAHRLARNVTYWFQPES